MKAISIFTRSAAFSLRGFVTFGLTLISCAQPTRTTSAETIVVPCVEGKVSPWRVTAGGHSDLEDPEGYEPPLLAPEASYGFSVLQIATGASTKVKLDEDVEAWLMDGRLLFQPQTNSPTDGSLWAFTLATGKKHRLTKRSCWYLQIALSPDGESVQYICGTRDGAQNASQVHELSLRMGEVKELSEKADWAEFHWPSYSPNGRQAFIRRTTKVPTPKESLVVGGRHVVECDGCGRNEWLDDQMVLWKCGGEIAIVDV